MKKITSENLVSFQYDGSTLLEIDSEGCLASDEAARVAKERLGDQITVEDYVADEVVDDTPKELTLVELRIKAEDLGLSKSGSKADLEERIKEHLATPADEVEG